jgi:peptidoglycan/xylan/chitin deacetylase (PgdA/CDA1 family)
MSTPTPTTRPSSRSLALSVVVNVEEGAEMSPADGDRNPDAVDEMSMGLRGPYRNFGNESNYAYGIKEGFDRVLRVLDQAGVPATWTCAARALERAPHIGKAIADRGDEAASHGLRWVPQHRMERDEEREFLLAARDSIEKTTGTAPVGHLSRYLHTENTRELLAQEGFLYHMDDYSGDEPFWDSTPAGPIVVLPYAIDTNDMKMWATPGYTARDWLDYACDSFDQLYAERREGFRLMSLGLHLRIIGRPGRIGALTKFLEHVQAHEDVWFVRRRDLASAFAAEVSTPLQT